MISKRCSPKEAIRTTAVLAASALVIGVAACGGSGGGAGGPSNAALPRYQPASIVSDSSYSTVLTSPDSVSKVGSYYEGVLANGGWQLRSSSNTPYSASFTAHRDNEGVTISVYPRGSGAGISISTHPE